MDYVIERPTVRTKIKGEDVTLKIPFDCSREALANGEFDKMVEDGKRLFVELREH